MSLSKNQIKFITSLQQKKYRDKENLFLVEGIKVVDEFLKSNLKLHSLYYTEAANYANEKLAIQISENELKKISNLKSPNKVLAVFYKPDFKIDMTSNLTLALDDINDPGNLGTIIRLCDWFAIKTIICSMNTVDCYNPKVIQASMGSFTRVNLMYSDLVAYLKNAKKPILVADMYGENMYQFQFPKDVILVMGNEANGISKEVMSLATNTISIPKVGEQNVTESLNVATATAILISEYARGF